MNVAPEIIVFQAHELHHPVVQMTHGHGVGNHDIVPFGITQKIKNSFLAQSSPVAFYCIHTSS